MRTIKVMSTLKLLPVEIHGRIIWEWRSVDTPAVVKTYEVPESVFTAIDEGTEEEELAAWEVVYGGLYEYLNEHHFPQSYFFDECLIELEW